MKSSGKYLHRFVPVFVVITAMLTLFASTGHTAHVEGAIKTDDGQIHSGRIRYLSHSKKYEVIDRNARMNYPERSVVAVRVKEPDEIKQASRLIQQERYTSAIPKLEQVVREYKKLQWDVVATEWLAKIYDKTGRPEKVASAVQALKRAGSEERITGELLDIYIDALIKLKRTADVQKMLDIQIRKGTREAAAVAQIKRGDLEISQGNPKIALRDGYLRTIVLFSAVKEAQPEALFKAAKAFEALGRSTDAEKMRQILLAQYPTSSYGQKLKSGT
ncbi:MAG: hypothetical protein R6V03_09415 [Kiritimatiellia bacterium]